MLVMCKEIRMRGDWHRVDVRYIKRETELISLFFQYSDTLRRKYSMFTQLEIDFSQPDSAIRTSGKNHLQIIRDTYGRTAFDHAVGYFPFDPVDIFFDPEESSSLAQCWGITDARVITFGV